MNALILCAGFGTRLLPHTRRFPKPLFPMAGRAMMDIVISRLVSAGVETIVVNTHHLHEMIEDHISKSQYPVPVFTSHEPVIRGTGGAIKANSDRLGPAPFIVINADIDTDIDIKAVYASHLANTFPVTLVLHDYPEFNRVTVDTDGFIKGFKGACGAERVLAFTGIQVLDQEAAAFMPETVPGSSITGYEKMISRGGKIKAHIVEGCYWNDVGTPERFIESAARSAAPNVFKSAFNQQVPVEAVGFSRLSGDGSDRVWHRVFAGRQRMIMAGHGLTSDAGTCEADAFVNIGRHLYERGVPVPDIYAYDRFSGLVFLEDLGDARLCDRISEISNDPPAIIAVYKKVLDAAAVMWVSGHEAFDRSWTFQTPEYDKTVIIEKECRYFFASFVNGHLGMRIDPSGFEGEFDYLAERILENQVTGFMHRDFQSANIMIRKGRPFFIDFQAGRAGPIQYDLASLLADPYVCLPESPLKAAEGELLDYAVSRLSQTIPIDRSQFISGYRYCRISRLLQALGAFGFLSDVKKKPRFAAHMPAALESLRQSLADVADPNLSGLKQVVERAETYIYSKNKQK